MEKLIKAIVLKDFYDKENRGLLLKEGNIIERSEARINFLAEKGFVAIEKESIKNDAENVEVEKPKAKGKSKK